MAIFAPEKYEYLQSFRLKNRSEGYLSKPSRLGVQKRVRNRFPMLKLGPEAFPGRWDRFPAGFRPKVGHFVDA